MGAYLSAPVTNKELFEGSSPDVIYGGASMQVCLFGRPDASGLLHKTSAWRLIIFLATVSNCVCIL